MARYILTTFIALLVANPSPAQSQKPVTSVSQRTTELAALFSKNKHVVKEKRGVRMEKYKKVVAKPVIAANPATYSGTYRDLSFDFVLRLRVAGNGNVEGSGEDPIDSDAQVSRRFALVDGKIQGALLTATKLFPNGRRERIEGVFIERTSFDSPSDRGVTVFGLGVVSKPMQIGGNDIDRLFYERASGQMAQGYTGHQ